MSNVENFDNSDGTSAFKFDGEIKYTGQNEFGNLLIAMLEEMEYSKDYFINFRNNQFLKTDYHVQVIVTPKKVQRVLKIELASKSGVPSYSYKFENREEDQHISETILILEDLTNTHRRYFLIPDNVDLSNDELRLRYAKSKFKLFKEEVNNYYQKKIDNFNQINSELEEDDIWK